MKAFGARMVKDHTAANADLVKVAAAKGVTVPGTIDKSHQKGVDALAKKSGADFDKAYVKAMVADHKTDVSDFEKQAKSGKDADPAGVRRDDAAHVAGTPQDGRGHPRRDEVRLRAASLTAGAW